MSATPAVPLLPDELEFEVPFAVLFDLAVVLVSFFGGIILVSATLFLPMSTANVHRLMVRLTTFQRRPGAFFVGVDCNHEAFVVAVDLAVQGLAMGQQLALFKTLLLFICQLTFFAQFFVRLGASFVIVHRDIKIIRITQILCLLMLDFLFIWLTIKRLQTCLRYARIVTVECESFLFIVVF